jgi:hypothetical protein
MGNEVFERTLREKMEFRLGDAELRYNKKKQAGEKRPGLSTGQEVTI